MIIVLGVIAVAICVCFLRIAAVSESRQHDIARGVRELQELRRQMRLEGQI